MSTSGFPEIDGYTVRRSIGAGGFSTVYEATQDDIGSSVALKVLNVSIHDEAGTRRLAREYRSMGRLRDQAGIVPVYGTALTADGHAVIAMAFMPGGSLLDRIRRAGPLSGEDAERVALELSTALIAAHAAGIHHRDIKPENVLFDVHGHAALSDFGLATLEGIHDASATAASLSPRHAPPERFTGDDADGPVTSDIYSLASTLFQAVTGAPPYGTSALGGIGGLITRVCSDPIPVIDRPDVPAGLRTAIEAGLAKSSTGRPATASEFRDLVAGVEPPTMLATAHSDDVRPVRDDDADHTKSLPEDSNPTRSLEAKGPAPEVRTSGRRGQWRSIAVIGATLLVLVGAFFSLSRYAHHHYYVAYDGQQVAVYQGVPGGFLIWQPEQVWRSSLIEKGDLTNAQRVQIKRKETFSSEAEARASVQRIEDGSLPATTTSTSESTTTTIPLRQPGEVPVRVWALDSSYERLYGAVKALGYNMYPMAEGAYVGTHGHTGPIIHFSTGFERECAVLAARVGDLAIVPGGTPPAVPWSNDFDMPPGAEEVGCQIWNEV